MSFADETHVVFNDLYSDQNPSNTIVRAPKQGSFFRRRQDETRLHGVFLVSEPRKTKH